MTFRKQEVEVKFYPETLLLPLTHEMLSLVLSFVIKFVILCRFPLKDESLFRCERL